MNDRQQGSKEEALTLELLQAIEQKNDVTQRHLADKLGVALGLANSYLKRCVRKGLVKIHQAPANRYLYYLTPNGFTEKSRLTAQYLSHSFGYYRESSASINSIYQICEKQSWDKVILCGISELAEIACIRAHEHSIKIVGVFEPDSKTQSFLNFQIFSNLDSYGQADAFIITSLNKPKSIYEILLEKKQADRILIPEILGIKK